MRSCFVFMLLMNSCGDKVSHEKAQRSGTSVSPVIYSIDHKSLTNNVRDAHDEARKKGTEA